MIIFIESKRLKIEFILLLLTILLPLILIFAEPFTFFVNDKIYGVYTSLRTYIWISSFLLFCLLSLLNSFLSIIKSLPGKFKQATSSKFLLTLLLLLLFGLALKFKSGQTDWATASLILIYLCLSLYLILAYTGSFLLWLKRKPHQALTAFAAIIVFSWLIFTVNFIILYEKVRDLRWQDSEIESKIDEMNEATNKLWQQRAFEKK